MERIDTLGKIWTIYIIGVFAVIFTGTNLVFVSIDKFYEYSFGISQLISLGIFSVVMVTTIMNGWVQVPENWIWVVEFLGRHHGNYNPALEENADRGGWESGPYIAFPYFGLMTVRNKAFMGEQMMELYMNDDKESGYGEGVVEFEDSSAPVDAVVYFTIVDAYKATYNINDLYGSIGEKIDGAIRSYLGNFTIDEANRLKVQFNLARVLNGKPTGRDDKGILKTETARERNKMNKPGAHKDTDLWKEIRNNWGVEINSIAVSDIVLSDGVIKIREEKLVAQKANEVALIKKKTTITNAEAKKEEYDLHGQGIAKQFVSLAEQELKGVDAANYLNNKIKWEKVGDKTVIISNGNELSSIGASIGAGMKAVNK